MIRAMGSTPNALAIDARDLFSHVFWLLAWTWLTAGFLRQLLFCTIAVDGISGTKQDLTLQYSLPRGEGEA